MSIGDFVTISYDLSKGLQPKETKNVQVVYGKGKQPVFTIFGLRVFHGHKFFVQLDGIEVFYQLFNRPPSSDFTNFLFKIDEQDCVLKYLSNSSTWAIRIWIDGV